ncbi:putative signal transducing protein [Cochleicola gelatinilyticus]|uniref:DUF2007 domain-containing protein n=1 Tax=Cochleicola gelatinilyticus TaxID=1763537 RepID=A0A167IUK2_9FLAO|nr:DUF2007 domain-containing protein [Cochleicola gelatinilyticus]OAB80029.1 hypothetical protein ULVI_04625 [Cochleicola gelatinilyticus]
MSNTFTTIATFVYSSEAKIIKGRLESEGIDAFLQDDLTIDTDPLVSNAIGGVKLRVRTEDTIKAKHIIASINPYSVNDQGEDIECPNCKSTKINYFTHITSVKTLLAFLFGFLFGGLPFYTKYEYTCVRCKTKFSLEK